MIDSVFFFKKKNTKIQFKIKDETNKLKEVC